MPSTAKSTMSASTASRHRSRVRSELVGAIGVTGRSKEALKPHIQTVQHIAEVISHILSRGS